MVVGHRGGTGWGRLGDRLIWNRSPKEQGTKVSLAAPLKTEHDHFKMDRLLFTLTDRLIVVVNGPLYLFTSALQTVNVDTVHLGGLLQAQG